MTVAAAVVDLADLYRPKAICVDDGGVGGGVAGAEPWSIWAGRGGVLAAIASFQRVECIFLSLDSILTEAI